MPRLLRTLAPALTAVPLSAALAVALVAAPAGAGPRAYPTTIDLPTGSMPEGIAAGPGDTFYAGARSDGAVYIGDAGTGTVRRLVKGDGEPAVGMQLDAVTGRLWVAGGTGGDVTAYDARTGRQLFRADLGSGLFLNDVTVTPEAVYVTDSRSNALVVVPTPGGALPADGTASRLVLQGVPAPAPGAFGPNGIRDLPDGDLVVVSQGVLYRVDLPTGTSTAIPVEGTVLRAGDGLELSGRTLYVVNGLGGNEVVELRFDEAYASAAFVRTLTAPELDRPTTGALLAGALYVVNGRFGTLAADPSAPVYVTRLPL